MERKEVYANKLSSEPEFNDPLYPKNVILPERVKITQHEADKQSAMQQELAVQRHEQLQSEEQYKLKQNSYMRVLELRKALREAEQNYEALYQTPVVKEEPKKKKERSMVLRDGVWCELE